MLSSDIQRQHRFSNRILQNLSSEVIARLQLKSVSLPLDRELELPGKPIAYLYFFESGVASMTTTFRGGRQVEVGLFGFESVVGASALMGTKRSLNRIFMQIAGSGFAAPIEAARQEFTAGSIFHDLVLRLVQAQIIQIAQSAGCNASHDLEQRLSRWLLICADRSRLDSFAISQQFLGMMLGVQRSSVNVALNRFEERGLLTLHRGRIQVQDFEGLQRQACECYQVVKRHLDNFAEYDSGQHAKLSHTTNNAAV